MDLQFDLFGNTSNSRKPRRPRVADDVGKLEAECLLQLLKVCDANAKLPRGFVTLVWEVMTRKQPETKEKLEETLRERAGTSDPLAPAAHPHIAIHHRLDGTYVWSMPELVEHRR